MFSKVDITETELYQAFPNIKQTLSIKLENKITEFYTKLSHNLETLEQQKEDVLNLCDKCESLSASLELQDKLTIKVDQLPLANMLEFVFALAKLYIHHLNSMRIFLKTQGKAGNYFVGPGFERICQDFFFI